MEGIEKHIKTKIDNLRIQKFKKFKRFKDSKKFKGFKDSKIQGFKDWVKGDC
jgi:hypothetical protein